MDSLGIGLTGQALLIRRVAELLYKDAATLRVEVDADFEAGSLIVPVHILADGVHAAEHLLSSEATTAIANLMQILGFFGLSGVSIYSLFKRLKGRKIEKPSDLPRELKIDVSVDLLIRTYNDNDVQAHLRKTLDPLHMDGIEEFQTRRAGIVLSRVNKTDLLAADEAELEDHIKDEEIELAIEKAAWRRDLAWHFSDGSTSFDAKIEDIDFWKRVEGGEAFADGDRMRVHLKTSARRTRRGGLKVQRVIPKVLAVEHARRAAPLFRDESAG